MSDEEIDPNTLSSLRVVDLKEELERRGLLKSGTKKELVERLRTYLKLERERKEIGNRSDHEAPNTKLLENKGLAGNDLVKQYLAKQQAMLTERSVSFMSDEGASSPDVSRSEVPSKTTPVVEVEPVTSAGSTQPGTSSASDSSPLSGRASRSSSRRDRLKTQHESGATPCRAAAAADLSARRSRRTRSSDSTSAEPGHDAQAEEGPVDYSMHAAADDKLKDTERVDAAVENEAVGTPECVKADEPVVGESPRVEPVEPPPVEPQASTKPIGEKTAVVAKLPQQEVKRHTELAAKPQKNSIAPSSTAEAGQCDEKPSKETPSKHSTKVSSASSVPVDKSAPVLSQSLKKDSVSVAVGDKAAASADTKHDSAAPPPSSDHKPTDTEQSQHTEPARALPDKTERRDHQTCSVASHCQPEPGTESLKKTAAPSDDSGKNVHSKLNAELSADSAAVEQNKTDTGSDQTKDQLPSKNETTSSIALDAEPIDGGSKSTTNESKHATSRSTDQQMETTSDKSPKVDRKRLTPVTDVIEVSKTAAAAADSLTVKHVAVKHTASVESPAGVSKSDCDLPKFGVEPATEGGCKDTAVTSKTDVLSAGTRETAKVPHVSCDDKLKSNKAEESDSKATAATSSHSPSLSAPTESKSTAPNVSKDSSTIQETTSVASVSRHTKSQKSVSNSSDKSSKPSASAECGPSERADGGQDAAQSTDAPKQSAFKRPADKVDGVAPVGGAGSSPGSAGAAGSDGVSPPSRGDRTCSSARATVIDTARAVGERKPLIRRRVVSPVEHSSPSPSPSITTTAAAASASSQSHETRPSSAARSGAGTPVEDTGDDVDCLEMERSEWLEDSDFWSAAKSERQPSHESVSQPVTERVSRRARVSDLPSSSPQQQRHSSSASVSKSSSSVDKRTRSDGSGDESGVVAAKECVVSETEGRDQQLQQPATADSSSVGQPATKFRRIMVHRKSSDKKSQSAGDSSSWNRVNVQSSATISISSDSLNALLPCTPSLSATPAGNGAVSDAADAVSTSHAKRHSSSVSPPRANGDHSAPQRHSPSPPPTAAAPPGTGQQRHRHTSRDQSAARVEEGPQPPPSIRRTITQRVGDAAAGGGGSSSMTAAAAGGRSDQLLERPPSPARYQVSSVVFLRNLVRPFTVAGLKELLARTGTITDFWINNIKSKCCCQYESVEQAVETRTALHRVRWPPSNPKLLLVDYGSEQMLADYKAADQIAAGACPAPVPQLDPHFATRQQEQLRQQQQQQQRRETVREWDRVKLGERSPGEKERERERKRAREAAEQKAKERQCDKDKRQAEETASAPVAPPIPDTPVKLLDDLFRKTVTTPCIYWLPLTEQQIADRHEERRQRALERQKRLAERRDVSAADHRSRSRSRHR